jgi:chemotaxis protein CheZ
MPKLRAENTKLRSEILNLFQYIQRMRKEIAQMSVRDDDRTHFETASEHLDAIVTHTEDATNGILEQLEGIDALVEEIRESVGEEHVSELCDRICERTMNAIEACTFQDITGQRVSRVIKSMKFVEDRVDAMIDLWGRDDIEALGIELPDDKPTGDEALLNGPQIPGQEISQDEIDKLFA